jgi:hypothetical protein
MHIYCMYQLIIRPRVAKKLFALLHVVAVTNKCARGTSIVSQQNIKKIMFKPFFLIY